VSNRINHRRDDIHVSERPSCKHRGWFSCWTETKGGAIGKSRWKKIANRIFRRTGNAEHMRKNESCFPDPDPFFGFEEEA
jgi:hypothetical protein